MWPESTPEIALERATLFEHCRRAVRSRLNFGYTGSAAWMYRAWIKEVLGLKVRGDRLQLNPVIPGHWEGFELRYRHGEAIYEIRVENPEGLERGVARVELDGQQLKEGLIPLERALVKHRIVVRMGKA